MTLYSYIGFVQVTPDNTVKTIDEKWLTDLPPFEPKDHIAPDRMALAIFNHNNISSDPNALPPVGFYRLTARGLLRWGMDEDGGTVHVTFEYAGHQPASERNVDEWFIHKAPTRPIFVKATIEDEPPKKE